MVYKRKLWILGISMFFLLSIFYFFTEYLFQFDTVPLTAHAISLPSQEKSNYSLPIRFKIPSISIDTAVEFVGLTLDGSMDSPIGPNNVGWFDLGSIPGDVGSAVIDGHSGWAGNKEAVFDNLYKLKIGDTIYVQDRKGINTTFSVREFKTYSLTEDVSSVFTSSDGLAHLNLITCNGIWNPKTKSHSSRLVVFTDKINE